MLFHLWNVLVRAGHLGVGAVQPGWAVTTSLHCLAAYSPSRRTGHHPPGQLQLGMVTCSLRGWRGERTHPWPAAGLTLEASWRRATATWAKVTSRAEAVAAPRWGPGSSRQLQAQGQTHPCPGGPGPSCVMGATPASLSLCLSAQGPAGGPPEHTSANVFRQRGRAGGG